MVAFADPSQAHPIRFRPDMIGMLFAGWHAMRRHRRMRQELVVLSKKSPRLLIDMGLDPESIYEALDGTWDEVGPAHLSRLLRSHPEV